MPDREGHEALVRESWALAALSPGEKVVEPLEEEKAASLELAETASHSLWPDRPEAVGGAHGDGRAQGFRISFYRRLHELNRTTRDDDGGGGDDGGGVEATQGPVVRFARVHHHEVRVQAANGGPRCRSRRNRRSPAWPVSLLP